MKKLNLTSKKIQKQGFPGTIISNGKKFQLSSIWYFSGDVERLKKR